MIKLDATQKIVDANGLAQVLHCKIPSELTLGLQISSLDVLSSAIAPASWTQAPMLN